MMHKNYNEKKSESGVMSALVMGAALGAAAMVLSKKENRKMIRSKVNELLEMGEDRMERAGEAIDELKDQGRKRIAQQVTKVSDKLQETEGRMKK
jgi:hypothetical protein